LPFNWASSYVGNVSNITAGQSPSGENLHKKGIEFHQGKLHFGEKYLKSSQIETNSPTKIINPKSIVICVRAPVGDVNITNSQICIGRGLAGIEPYSNISLDYLYYFLKNKKEYFELNGTGSTFKSISVDCIKKLSIEVPPYTEQLLIVQTINKLHNFLSKIKTELV